MEEKRIHENQLRNDASQRTDSATVHQQHEHQSHNDAEFHHHHSHAPNSSHKSHHHLLQVEDLNVSFRMYEEGESVRDFLQAKQHVVDVIHNLSISVHEGEVVAIVGASGSGKTLLADSILGIFEPNSIVSGKIWFDGELQDAQSLSQLRGSQIALIPQSVAALDPLMKVGKQVIGFAKHSESKQALKSRQRELFERYGLSREVEKMYPHELSGGMARRVLLCVAMMTSPKLIIADEPTPGLDLELAIRALDDLREFANDGGGVMLITHDLELALRVADRIAVFKDGTVVEETDVASFMSRKALRHEFSRALWDAMPEHGFNVPAGLVDDIVVNASDAEDDGETTDSKNTDDVNGVNNA